MQRCARTPYGYESPLPQFCRAPNGGQDAIRRVMLMDKGTAKTLLGVIRDRANAQGGRQPARADLRFGTGPDNQVFVLNKQDGIVRLLTR